MARRKAVRRRERVEESENKKPFREPEPSTRLERVRKALMKINFGYTIFFTNERGKSVKLYCGAVEQENQW